MTNDPNRKQSDMDEQTGQSEQQKNQPNKNQQDDATQRRPSQGGHDAEQDQPDQDRQRRAS